MKVTRIENEEECNRNDGKDGEDWMRRKDKGGKKMNVGEVRNADEKLRVHAERRRAKMRCGKKEERRTRCREAQRELGERRQSAGRESGKKRRVVKGQ